MNADKTRTHYETLAKQAAGEKVDVLARILNCGESMRDVHEVAAELIAANIEQFAATQACVDATRSGGHDAMCAAGWRASKAGDRLREALARIGSTP
ncbi:hypothetical protein FHW84_001789 [Dyella sp. SG562]|uniref:hypothetical protein n=1 Tax=Dyella sp. SG562 TaxID=2587017 RepID=UPI00141E4F4D|nr:hypothetical protein [Dyella sp. SG562]NII73220.1 hypothetical protein [Dyella sp. SG562]